MKYVFSREDSFLESSKRHPFRLRYKAGVTKEGKIIAFWGEQVDNSGAYNNQTQFMNWRANVHSAGPYEIENIHTDTFGVFTNNIHGGAMRGYSSPSLIFGQEQFIDELAEAIGMDNVQFRKINCLKDGSKTVSELMNDYSPAAMDSVEKYLKLLKPNVAGWEADFGKEMMTKGKAWLNMTWSGDAQWAIEEAQAVGVDLAYTVPEEGSNVWYDGWVIPRYARNKEAASYFINFLCRPDIALRNMEENGYVSSIAAPEILEACTDSTLTGYVDASYFFGDRAKHVKLHNTQYPDRSVIARCAMIRDFGEHTAQVLEIWSRVKGDNLNSGIVVLILVVVGGLSLWQIHRRWTAYKRKRLQHRKRRRVIRR